MNTLIRHLKLLFQHAKAYPTRLPPPAALLLCVVVLICFTQSAWCETYRPAPITPENATETTYPFPNFSWSRHPHAWDNPAQPARYQIEIAREVSFETIIDSDTVSIPRYVHDRPLPVGTYYWRVRSSTSEADWSAWSRVARFTIKSSDCVLQVAPKPGHGETVSAIRKVMAQAGRLSRQGKTVRVNFKPGVYVFGEAFRGPLIELENASKIVIDGTGARIRFSTRRQGLFEATDCNTIAIMGFTCTYPRGAYGIQGYVRAVDSATDQVRLSIEPGYPGFDVSQAQSFDILMLLEPGHKGRLKDDVRNFFRGESFQKNADGTWTVQLAEGQAEEWGVGDRYRYNFRTGSKQLVNCAASEAVTAYRITTTGYGGMQYVSIEGSLFSILHGKTVLANGDWMTGNADGVHIRGHRVGPWIEHTLIQAIGDDAVALYARPASIQAPMPDGAANAAIFKPKYFNLEPGDDVSFFRPQRGVILLETQVVSVKTRRDGSIYVRFADDLPKQIKTNGQLVENTQVWNRSKSCGDFMVRNCTFKNIRRYGVVFRSKGGVVENNRFTGICTIAIVAINGTQWPNGLYASEIVVRNNKITDVGFTGSHRSSPIAFLFNGYRSRASTIGPRNLLIENNLISDIEAPAIQLSWVDRAVLKHNRIQQKNGTDAEADFVAAHSTAVTKAK